MFASALKVSHGSGENKKYGTGTWTLRSWATLLTSARVQQWNLILSCMVECARAQKMEQLYCGRQKFYNLISNFCVGYPRERNAKIVPAWHSTTSQSRISEPIYEENEFIKWMTRKELPQKIPLELSRSNGGMHVLTQYHKDC